MEGGMTTKVLDWDKVFTVRTTTPVAEYGGVAEHNLEVKKARREHPEKTDGMYMWFDDGFDNDIRVLRTHFTPRDNVVIATDQEDLL